MILIIKSGQLAYAGTVSSKPECMVTLIIVVPTSSGCWEGQICGKSVWYIVGEASKVVLFRLQRWR